MSKDSIIDKAERASEGVAELLRDKPNITQVFEGDTDVMKSKASVRLEFSGPGCIDKMHRAYDALQKIIG